MNIQWFMTSASVVTKRTNNGCSHRELLSVIVIQLMVIFIECTTHVSTQTSSPKQIHRHQELESIRLDSGPAFQVLVNRQNNDVIVGARNAIYRLSATKNSLSIEEQYRTGPVNDSINCLPPPNPCPTAKLTDNDNQILLLDYTSAQFPLLLACGKAYQGMCHLFKSSNISGFSKMYGSPNDTMNFVGSRTSSVAFFAPSVTEKVPSKALFVANAYDGRPLHMSPPSVSSRKLYGYHGLVLWHNKSTSYSKVDFDAKYKQTFNVKYIYGFNHSHYSYFVSVQPINVRTQEYETKVIRICQHDNEFFSYMEMPVQCSSPESAGVKQVEYMLASAAYYGPIGADNYERMGVTGASDAGTLFLTMGVPGAGWAVNKRQGSAICAFSLNQMNRAFTEAARQCFRADSNTKVHLLELIHGQRRDCTRYDVALNDTFCGSGLNPYIETNRPLDGLFLAAINGHVTSLAVDVHNRHTVAAVGTEEGLLSKVVLDGRQESDKQILEYNMGSDSDDVTDRSIRPNPAFDNKRRDLYVLSGRRLIRVPFGSCRPHQTCDSCLTSNDPLACGWCGTYCAHRDECDPLLFNQTVCPPVIYDFEPKSGPLRGGTVITITGNNLGQYRDSYENSNITVTVAETNCPVVEWTASRVTCQTQSVLKAVSGKVRVKVHDRFTQKIYDIEGEVQSDLEFKYLEPELRGVYPAFGPESGGTNITIVGQNLHIGSNRTVLLAGIQCKEFESNSTFLKCTSGRRLSTKPEKAPLLSSDTTVRLFIDSESLVINQNKTIHKPFGSNQPALKSDKSGDSWMPAMDWSEYFEYRPDPVITAFGPNSTIKSGDTNITVTGVNLNSVANPRLRVVAYSGTSNQRRYQLDGQCWADPTGARMTCQTPDFNRTDPPLDVIVSKDTKLSFIMDGVVNSGLNERQLRLIYFPDPTFHAFKEGARVVYIEEPVLKIDGKDLRIDYPIDIRVSEHHIYCNLTESKTFDAIYCKIEQNEKIWQVDGNEHRVLIRVGKINFSPGNMTFANKPAILSLGSILLIISLPILLIIAIVALIYYYGQKKGISLFGIKPPIDQFGVNYTNRSISQDPSERPPYVSQSSSNDYGRGSESSRLLPDGRMISTGSRRYEVSDETMSLLRSEHILIERHNIVFEEVIGHGQFGQVFRAMLHSPEKEAEREVAVKTIVRDEMDVESFLQEGLLMKDFHHHHVLTLIGVCFEDQGQPMVVLPFMQNGDLLSYIRNENNNPTVKALLMFAIEIAMGMDYLCSQKFVHRDLAARNCMLDSDLCVKVADFGLARDIYERDYYSSDNKKCKLPVKWMSPESLEKGTYNTKTDVWSYGVVVWELLTRGVTPYPDVDNWEILNYLKQGRRMPRPSFCPELLYYILLRCWSDDHRQRPTFGELVSEVQEVITTLEMEAQKQRVDLDKCNTYINFPVPNVYYNESQIQSQPKVVTHSNDRQMNDQNVSEPPNGSVYETTC